MDDCLFCGIIAGSIPSAKVYEDDLCYAFLDISPQAKEHILLIPKQHFSSLEEAEDAPLLGHLLLTCARIARERGLSGEGYRVVTNIGKHGCQTVGHLHIHIMGGEQLDGRMG